MNTLYETASLAYGLGAIAVLLLVTVWVMFSVYVFQASKARLSSIGDDPLLGLAGFASWVASVFFALAAVAHLVLA